MGSRSKNRDRCSRCFIRRELCFCSEIPSLSTQTHILILMHWREALTTTNTARIASLCLKNSEIRIRGKQQPPQSDPSSASINDKSFLNRQVLFLFPSSNAIELSAEYLRTFTQPITLVVPDGSWRQAKRVGRREPFLEQVPHIKLPPGRPSDYFLRKEPNSEALCTFEAIARALGFFESPQVQQELEKVFYLMQERILQSRKPAPIRSLLT